MPPYVWAWVSTTTYWGRAYCVRTYGSTVCVLTGVPACLPACPHTMRAGAYARTRLYHKNALWMTFFYDLAALSVFPISGEGLFEGIFWNLGCARFGAVSKFSRNFAQIHYLCAPKFSKKFLCTVGRKNCREDLQKVLHRSCKGEYI